MAHEITSNSIKTLVAFLIGAGLGGVVVALTTSKRGTDLRKDLAGLGEKAKGKEGFTSAQKERPDNPAWPAKTNAEASADKRQSVLKDYQKGASVSRNPIKEGPTATARQVGT